MSKEYEKLALEALKDGLKALSRESPPNDVPIAFSEKGCRRVGEIISKAATTTRENGSKKRTEGSESILTNEPRSKAGQTFRRPPCP